MKTDGLSSIHNRVKAFSYARARIAYLYLLQICLRNVHWFNRSRYSLRILKLAGFALILVGIALFLISSIPITRTDEVINTSFTISPGDSFGPYDEGTYYHTRVLVRSILKITIVTEGGRIYMTVGGQNVQDLKNFYIEGGKSFTIAPASDQYTFIFDNKGMSDCTVEFVLKEVWTGSLSPLVWVLGQAGLLVMVPIGSGIIAYNHYAARVSSATTGR